jgi:dihydrofolate reductase
MGKVFVDVGMSLDGFIAGPNARPANPMGDGGTRIHQWVFEQASFRALIGMTGGQTGDEDARIRAVFARAGAYVMGRRMFDEGQVAWPENPPFRAPVFVLTHKPREPWVRQGGTTFTFLTDGIESALRQAKAAAGGKDVRISGGADAIRQYVKAGLVDELAIHLAPVLLGSGTRLFDQLAPADLALTDPEAAASPLVTHLSYRIAK